MPTKKRAKGKDITLRDVVVHMQAMEQRLSSKIEINTKKIDENTEKIEENTHSLAQNTSGLHQNTVATRDLINRVDALEEDLVAVIKDTVRIRKHVGIATEEE